MPLPPFQRFLDEHAGPVHRYLVAVAGPQEAEDCFQETFIAALRAYPRLNDGSNLRAWVLRIAQRKVIDAHRARSRRAAPTADLDDRPAPPGPPPGGDSALWDDVRALPPKQRAAVTLRFVGDLSHAEIGEVLGSSDEAARRNLHEGLEKLRKGWKP